VKVLKFVISSTKGLVVKETHLIGSALTVLEIPINKIKNIFLKLRIANYKYIISKL
jgi:hypothetical protein